MLKRSSLNVAFLLLVFGQTSAQVMVGPTDIVVSESGSQAAIGVFLASDPGGPVMISVGNSDFGEFSVSPNTLSFDSSDFSTAKFVTVAGVDDAIADGNNSGTISFSGDGTAMVGATNIDDESPSVLFILNTPVMETGVPQDLVFRVSSAPGDMADIVLTLTQDGMSGADITGLPPTVTLSDTSYTGIVSFTPTADLTPEGLEVFQIDVVSSSTNSSYNGQSFSVTAPIQDTSTPVELMNFSVD